MALTHNYGGGWKQTELKEEMPNPSSDLITGALQLGGGGG